MSALAGIWNFNGRPDAEQTCVRMLAVQSIYGPHDSAHWSAGSIALGRDLYRRLPEDVHDEQPLVGGEGRFVLIADIRLDNRDELTGDLGISSGRAAVNADSAIVLAAWERWQEACIDRLVGDFSIVVFDRSLMRLVLARDPIGNRPLHYHRGAGFFAFASMPKGLHALPEIPRRPDEEKIAEHLVLLPESGTRSFFKDVERVESGSLLTVTPSGVTASRHWDPARKLLKLKDADAYAEGLRHNLDQAVRARLRGAGSLVGAHLSSGFDSSAVATSAALLQAPHAGRVAAFTSVPREGYSGPAPRARIGNEGPIAALTAARYPNIDHVLVRTPGRSPVDNLDRAFFIFERPILNLCNNVWMTAINEAAQARGIGVMLTGQMGNMSISYDGLTLLPELIRSGRWVRWLREGSALVRSGNQRLRNVLAQSFGPFMPSPVWSWINRTFRGVDSAPETYSAIRPGLLRDLDIGSRARANGLDLHYRPRVDGFESRLWAFRRVDFGNYNKGLLAGWGLDSRDPTADRRLMEFCLSLPEELFLSGGESKALARRAFAGRLPAEVITMHGKGYQAVDWHEGLATARHAIDEEIGRLEGCGPAANAIDLPRLKKLMAQWPTGGWENEAVLRNYRIALLRALSTGHFLRRASGSNS